MARLRTGDEVVVISGNDRGKTGKVLRVNGERVLVEGVNIRKKHRKANNQGGASKIIDIECSIHCSNVKLWVKDRAVRLKARLDQEGKKEWVYLNQGQLEVYRPVQSSSGKG